MNTTYLPRIIDDAIENKLVEKGAICVEGPKWCGKTSSAMIHAKSVFNLGDAADNFRNKTMAQNNPLIALMGETPHLIDEWQEVPAIWDAVRSEVDKRQERGLFLLSGSSTPKYKGVLHSGTGRIAKIRMRTMSLYESKESEGVVSLKSLFDNTFSDCLCKSHSIEDIAKYIVRGGWPGTLSLDDKHIEGAAKDYITSFFEDDLPRILDNESTYRDIRKIRYLMASLARNETTTVSISKISRDIEYFTDIKIKEETINDYLELLKRAFIIEDQEAFSFSSRSATRLKIAPKRHLTDPSLAVALLNLTKEKLLNDLETFGFMFEALVERDLSIYAQAIGGKLYHYQDYKNKEIDAVVALDDGRWGAFEVKLGNSQIDKASENLLKIQDLIEADNPKNKPAFLAVITASLGGAYRRSDGVYVVPITALKP